MKLKMLTLALAVCGMMLSSCGNSANSGNENAGEKEAAKAASQVETYSCDAEEVCNDSIVTRSGEAPAEGFGRCSKCNCKKFEGRGQTCGNCGHAYRAHY